MADINDWHAFFKSAGVPKTAAVDYAITFTEQRIQKSMLSELTKEMLCEMGINLMGDIIAILRQARIEHSEMDLQNRVAAVENLRHSKDVLPSKNQQSTNTSMSKFSERVTSSTESRTPKGEEFPKVLKVKSPPKRLSAPITTTVSKTLKGRHHHRKPPASQPQVSSSTTDDVIPLEVIDEEYNGGTKKSTTTKLIRSKKIYGTAYAQTKDSAVALLTSPAKQQKSQMPCSGSDSDQDDVSEDDKRTVSEPAAVSSSRKIVRNKMLYGTAVVSSTTLERSRNKSSPLPITTKASSTVTMPPLKRRIVMAPPQSTDEDVEEVSSEEDSSDCGPVVTIAGQASRKRLIRHPPPIVKSAHVMTRKRLLEGRSTLDDNRGKEGLNYAGVLKHEYVDEGRPRTLNADQGMTGSSDHLTSVKTRLGVNPANVPSPEKRQILNRVTTIAGKGQTVLLEDERSSLRGSLENASVQQRLGVPKVGTATTSAGSTAGLLASSLKRKLQRGNAAPVRNDVEDATVSILKKRKSLPAMDRELLRTSESHLDQTTSDPADLRRVLVRTSSNSSDGRRILDSTTGEVRVLKPNEPVTLQKPLSSGMQRRLGCSGNDNSKNSTNSTLYGSTNQRSVLVKGSGRRVSQQSPLVKEPFLLTRTIVR